MKLFGPRRPPRQLPVVDLRFLGEQDGKGEQLLKARLESSFRHNPSIQRAYLARISSGGQFSIALCLKTRGGPDLTLVGEVGDVFATLFARQQDLDILFLTEVQESELNKVCAPFYAIATPA